jgi:pimeloyl-ACP methyl ester carboxylesterase
VYDAGSGAPVVLIHGGQFGSLYSLDAWSLTLPGVAARRRVITFDRPGQGWTDAPPRDDELVMETVLEHAAEALAMLAGKAAHVVGHSRGGAIAARLALDHPELVATLTIVDSGSMAPFDPAIPVGAFYARFERSFDESDASDAAIRAEPDAQAVDRRWVTPDFIGRMGEIARRPETTEMRRRFAANELQHWRPSLERVRAETLARIDASGLTPPTLVVWAYEDRSAPRHQGHRLFERIAARTPDATFAMTNGAGHYVFRDRPAWFLATTSAFWGAHEQSGL